MVWCSASTTAAKTEQTDEVASVQLRKTNKNGEPDENSRPLLSDRECWAAPVLSHGLLYLRGQDRLVCVRLIPEKKK